MKKEIILSIIIPVFNSSQFLKTCIKSLCEQKLENYELIFVNDGSTDTSLNILELYKEKYNFINIINFEKNQGLSSARNAGLKVAQGEYISFVDADDFIEKDSLCEIKQIIDEYNTDLIVTKIDGFSDEYTKRSYIAPTLNEKCFNNYNIYDFFINLHKNNVGLGPCVRYFVKRNIVVKNKLKFENIFDEDQLWSLKLIINCSTVKLYYKNFYHYRLRKDSLSTNISLQRAKDLIKISKKIYKLQCKFPKWTNFIKLRSKYIYDKALNLLQLLHSDELKKFNDFINREKEIIELIRNIDI